MTQIKKESVGVCFFPCIFTLVLLPVLSTKQQRCYQEPFSPQVTTAVPIPLFPCTFIFSLQLLLHAASESSTQLRVVRRHVFPDPWHTTDRKALQDDWPSCQKVLGERFNFQPADHFSCCIAVSTELRELPSYFIIAQVKAHKLNGNHIVASAYFIKLGSIFVLSLRKCNVSSG